MAESSGSSSYHPRTHGGFVGWEPESSDDGHPFPPEVEKTWERSFEAFAHLVQEGRV